MFAFRLGISGIFEVIDDHVVVFGFFLAPLTTQTGTDTKICAEFEVRISRTYFNTADSSFFFGHVN